MNKKPPQYLRVYMAIRLAARFKSGNYGNVVLPPGSHVTTLSELAKTSGGTVKEIRTALGYLERARLVIITRAQRYHVITLLDYDTSEPDDESEGTSNNDAAGTNRARHGHDLGTIDAASHAKSAPSNTLIREDVEDGGIRHQNNPDSSLASSKNRSKTSQPAVVDLDADDRKVLSEAIAKHFGAKFAGGPTAIWPTGYLEPETSIVEQVLKFLTHELVTPFCEYLRRLPAEHQHGGRKAPKDWPWYVTVAQRFASEPTSPATDLTPTKFNEMTESF